MYTEKETLRKYNACNSNRTPFLRKLKEDDDIHDSSEKCHGSIQPIFCLVLSACRQ